MTRCCDRKPRPAHSITSLKVALSIVTVMCCAAIGLGLYGNDDLHNGLLEVLTAGRKVDNLVTTIRNQTHILENTLTNRIRPQLVELADIFDQPVSNQTALSKLFVSLNIVQGNVTLATNAASDIRRPLMGISMTHFLTVCTLYTHCNANLIKLVSHIPIARRPMGTHPLAGHGGHLGPATCLVCRAAGGRGPALAMRPNPVQRVRLASRHRFVAHVRSVSLLLGGCRRSVHLTSGFSGVHGTQGSAHECAAALHPMRTRPHESVYPTPEGIAEFPKQCSQCHGHGYEDIAGALQILGAAAQAGCCKCRSE